MGGHGSARGSDRRDRPADVDGIIDFSTGDSASGPDVARAVGAVDLGLAMDLQGGGNLAVTVVVIPPMWIAMFAQRHKHVYGTVMATFEDFGFCPKGQTGAFFAEGRATYGATSWSTRTAGCCPRATCTASTATSRRSASRAATRAAARSPGAPSARSRSARLSCLQRRDDRLRVGDRRQQRQVHGDLHLVRLRGGAGRAVLGQHDVVT